MKSFMFVIFKKPYVIVGFLLLKLLALGHSLMYSVESNTVLLVRVLAIFFLGALAFFSFRGNWVCGKALGVIIFLTGSVTFITSFLIRLNQWEVKLFFLVVGAYFAIGGFMLFRSEKRRPREVKLPKGTSLN